MSGHGTIIVAEEIEGTATIYISNNGNSRHYPTGKTVQAHGSTKSKLAAGNVVITEWNEQKKRVEVTKMGARARGAVSADGRTFRVAESGDTDLRGDVKVSTAYGDNGRYNGKADVSGGNINGEAAFLLGK